MQSMEKKAPSNISNCNTDFYEQPHDAILRTEDGSMYKIHRILLAKRSEYFRALFTCESNKNLKMVTILIKEISGQTLQQILHYLYEGALQLNKQNLQHIMIASDRMLLDDLIERCREFAIRRMTTSDCLPLLILATHHERLNIVRECSRYAKVHFEGIVKNFPQKIADLPIEVLTELLKNDSLNVASEDTVGTAIDVWVKADTFKRSQYIPDLLNCIRVETDKPPKTKRQEKAVGMSNPFFIESNTLSVEDSPDSSSISSFLQRVLHRETASRFPKYLHIVLKCKRSKSGHSSDIYLTFDEELDFWRKVSNVPWIPDVIVPIGKYVYLFVTGDDVVLRYDLLDESLIPLTGVLNRFYHRIVELHNKIYALGGITADTDQDIDTVECYNPDFDMWNYVRPVGKMIIDHAVTMCGRIYALGHSDTLDDIENTYSLHDLGETDHLYDLGDIDNPYDLGYTDNLHDPEDIDNPYDLGYTDNLHDPGDIDNPYDLGDTDNLNDLEETDIPQDMMWMRVYDPIIDTWNKVESPKVFRREFSAVVFQNRLYLIGAENNSSSSNCVEEYDPVPDVWTTLPDIPFVYLRPKGQVLAGRLIVFDNYNEENYHECRCEVYPAVCWNAITRVWKITNESFVFYNSVERYRFGILEDPAVVREVVNRGRRSAVQWDRIFVSK